jgi:hypothetical protein
MFRFILAMCFSHRFSGVRNELRSILYPLHSKNKTWCTEVEIIHERDQVTVSI